MNLVVVLTENSNYIEHLVQPIFINCSLDFDVTQEIRNTEFTNPGDKNLGEIRIGLSGSESGSNSDDDQRSNSDRRKRNTGGICNPKVFTCMACDHEFSFANDTGYLEVIIIND